MPTIQDNLSFVPLRIQMKFNETKLGVGTAFFYLYENKTYLITNWHNATGRSPNDLKPLSQESAIPNLIELPIAYSAKRENPDPSGGENIFWKTYNFSLYEEGIPTWYEHPVHGHKVDAVAFPLEGLNETRLFAANDMNNLNLDKIVLRPSLDAFVLGYPLGITGGANFPIWKRASIATEPDIDIESLPKFLIDTATREGMSGSPVYAQINGHYIPEGKEGLENAIFGEGRRFVGIYSGRLGSDAFQAQLGIVWKEKALIEIIEGKKIGISSYEI